jgi:hypothetical protein
MKHSHAVSDSRDLRFGRDAFAAALLLALSAVHGAAAAAIHVSPRGDDAAPGSAGRPVAALARAVDLARAEPADATSGQREVVVHGGRYYDTSLTLTPADSGLTIKAAPGERPVLVGGVRLGGWRREREGSQFWVADLPAPPAGVTSWDVRLLQVNGEVRPRARLPEQGTFTHLTRFDVPWMSTTGGGWKRKPTDEELTTLRYRPGDVPASLDPKSAEVTVYHMWDESCVGVASNDPAAGVMKLAPAAGHPPGAFGVRKFVLWNVREGLTRPGQWYHDRTSNRIVYWPRGGEDMARAEVIVPTRTVVVRIRGDASAPVRDVILMQLGVEVTNVPLIAAGFAAGRFDGAVSLEGAEDCRLEGLTVRNVAGHAIKAGRGCEGLRVEGCEVVSCGAGGIYVGGRKSVVSRNLVNGVGRSYPSAVGIMGPGATDCVVSHNEVHDCSYSAINYGGPRNTIDHNLIYDCMKVLHDGAAIYLFAGKDCAVRGNVARDIVDTGGYGASAYYLDEQSEGCVVEGNLSINVAWPTHNHMARGNTIRDNVFVTDGDLKLTFPRSSGYTLSGNVLYAGGRITIENPDAVTAWSKNLFFSGAGRIEGVKLDQYAKVGPAEAVRGDTRVADPLFEDRAKDDFRYRAGSPASELGLRPLFVENARRLMPAH